MSTELTQLMEINRALLTEVQAQRRMSDDLWSAQQIADYLHLDKEYAQKKIITVPGFPVPVSLPTAEKRGCRRWVAKEVKAWAMKHR